MSDPHPERGGVFVPLPPDYVIPDVLGPFSRTWVYEKPDPKPEPPPRKVPP